MRSPKHRLIIPLTVAVAFMMEQLDSTIITTAIPDLAHSIGTTPLLVNLAITGYVLSLAVFIPVSGWFVDRFGRRRVLMAAFAIFTIASGLAVQQSHLGRGGGERCLARLSAISVLCGTMWRSRRCPRRR